MYNILDTHSQVPKTPRTVGIIITKRLHVWPAYMYTNSIKTNVCWSVSRVVCLVKPNHLKVQKSSSNTLDCTGNTCTCNLHNFVPLAFLCNTFHTWEDHLSKEKYNYQHNDNRMWMSIQQSNHWLKRKKKQIPEITTTTK